jgi:hypothetical protein
MKILYNKYLIIIIFILTLFCYIEKSNAAKLYISDQRETNNNFTESYNKIIIYLQNLIKYQNYDYKPQFVVLAFDGSYSLDMWDKTIKFAKKMQKNNIPVRFTYFISGVYFIPEKLQNIYNINGYKKGHSDIGWADNLEDISKRINKVNTAYLHGHEIGSHANGHFDGSKWSENIWLQEFDYFNRFLFPYFDDKYPNLDKFQKRLPKLVFDKSDITGFRAPLLGHNNEMYKALKKNNFTYETNKVYRQKVWPKKGLKDIWEMPLSGITLGDKYTISMDYNIYYSQTKAKDIFKKNTKEWNKAYKDTLKAYIDYFNNNYSSNKAPVFIGHHFSSWNDGLYWEVMKTFAEKVCGKQDVICGTNKEVEIFLEKQSYFFK